MTTKQLTTEFLLWFQEKSPEGRIYRNNSGVAWNINKSGKKYPVKFGIPNTGGGADYIAFIPILIYCKHQSFGQTTELSNKIQKFLKAVFYELKLKNDSMSKKQIDFANLIASLGGEYYIVREKIKKLPDDNLNFSIELWENSCK